MKVLAESEDLPPQDWGGCRVGLIRKAGSHPSVAGLSDNEISPLSRNDRPLSFRTNVRNLKAYSGVDPLGRLNPLCISPKLGGEVFKHLTCSKETNMHRLLLCLLLAFAFFLTAQAQPGKPQIRKLGTIDCDLVETTPIVFQNRLYRFEYVRKNYKPNTTGDSYFHFIDVETGKPTASFAEGFNLGCANVDKNTVYVYGVKGWGTTKIYQFQSKDLNEWTSAMVLEKPNWEIFNTSVCRGPNGYTMAIEFRADKEECGVPFTIRFATSKNLKTWELLPADRIFTKDRYSSCPTLRFLDGMYYMIYDEELPGPTYEPYLIRSKDLIQWESSPFNPFMVHSETEDKQIANPNLTTEQVEHIKNSVNINNADTDLCEYNGKTVIYYCWGNQQGIEFLAEAAYDGPMEKLLKGFFPE